MMRRSVKRCVSVGALLALVFAWGCSAGISAGHRYPPARHPGPPAHAPAHGRRAQYRYRYYPHSHVYFDIDRRVYFYMEGEVWRMSPRLPHSIKITAKKGVMIDLDIDKPYKHFDEHKAKYPPGQAKKQGGPTKGKGQGKGKRK